MKIHKTEFPRNSIQNNNHKKYDFFDSNKGEEPHGTTPLRLAK